MAKKQLYVRLEDETIEPRLREAAGELHHTFGSLVNHILGTWLDRHEGRKTSADQLDDIRGMIEDICTTLQLPTEEYRV